MIYFLFFIFLFQGNFEIKEISFSGSAYDLRTKEYLYTETHRELYENKHLSSSITYTDEKGKVIAKKEIDYREDSLKPTFQLEDMRDGYLEGAKVRKDTITLISRKNKNSLLKEKTLIIPEPIIIDAGLNAFVRKNWDELEKGKTLKFNLAVPNELDYFSFRITKSGEKEIEKKKTIILKVEPSNFIIRALVNPIIIYYEKIGRAHV